MFLDSGPMGMPWGGPRETECKSCRMPILGGQPIEEVRFPPDCEGAEMSGLYHAECAPPFASIAHALGMLGRSFN